MKHFARVNWFNPGGGFGIAVTTSTGLSLENRPLPGNQIELFLHVSEMKDHLALSEGDWLTFSEAVVSHGKLSATKIAGVDYSKEDTLISALEYRGVSGRIHGVYGASHHRRISVDINILAHVFHGCEASMGAERVREILSTYINGVPPETRLEVLKEILSDDQTADEMQALYLPAEKPVDISEITAFIRHAVVEHILSAEPIRLSKIPSWCDLSGCRELLSPVIMNAELTVLAELIIHKIWGDAIFSSALVDKLNKAMVESPGELWRFAGTLFHAEQDRDGIVQIFLDLDGLDELVYAVLYTECGDEAFLYRVSDIPKLVEWLQKQTPEHFLEFLKNYSSLADATADSDLVVSEIPSDRLAEVIRRIPESERYMFLSSFPRSDVVRIV